jgi:GT2 family glycosyltransferase
MTATAGAADTEDVVVVRTASPAATVVVPPTEAPEVSFVTVTYGTGPIVVEMIASVAATCPVPFEVIVVDNPHPARPGRSRTSLLASTAGVRVVEPRDNLGFGGGCNLGARLARGRLLALVNPDVVAAPGWLEPLVATLDRDASVGVAAAVLLDPDGTVQECGQELYADGTTAPIRTIPHRESDAIDADAAIDVAHASAACWLVRTHEFLHLGGFDPAFHPAYFEDVDLALRVRRAGRRVVVHPSSSVRHARGTGTPDRARPAFRQLATLRAKWPDLASTHPRPPAG